MIHRFDINFGIDPRTTNLEIQLELGKKGYHEFQKAHEFITLWKEIFENRYGNLLALSHLSNPDDPPDIIAHFERSDLPVEITSITPPHVLQSDATHRGSGNNVARHDIPISKKPKNAKEAKDWMYGTGGEWDNLMDSNKVWNDNIVSSSARKFSKSAISRHKNGLLILETDRLFGYFNEDDIVKTAIQTSLTHLPNDSEWMIAVHNQWNSLQCFSVIGSRSITLTTKRKV